MTFLNDRDTLHPVIQCDGCTPRRQQLNISFLTESSLTVVCVSRKSPNAFRIGTASIDRVCIPSERWFSEKAKYFVVDASAIQPTLRTLILDYMAPRFDSVQFQFVIDNEYILTPTIYSSLFNSFTEAIAKANDVLNDVLSTWDNASTR